MKMDAKIEMLQRAGAGLASNPPPRISLAEDSDETEEDDIEEDVTEDEDDQPMYVASGLDMHRALLTCHNIVKYVCLPSRHMLGLSGSTWPQWTQSCSTSVIGKSI